MDKPEHQQSALSIQPGKVLENIRWNALILMAFEISAPTNNG